MDNLRIGDVVFLNSEERVKITVAEIGDDKTFQGVYYNDVKHEFLYTPKLHFDMVTKES